jgi:hypothetical protein
MKLWDVERGDDFYLQALEIRRNLLFKGVHDADVYMNDPWENKSMHVVVEHLGKFNSPKTGITHVSMVLEL